MPVRREKRKTGERVVVGGGTKKNQTKKSQTKINRGDYSPTQISFSFAELGKSFLHVTHVLNCPAISTIVFPTYT